jgi:hypothetical protein
MYEVRAMTRVTGGCHCGAVGFEVTGEFSAGMECNCSHCDIKGLLLAFVPRSDFALTRGDDETCTYHFNRGVIDHVFCKTCGVEAFGFGAAPDGTKMAAINLRCVNGVDRNTLTIQKVNGKDF